MSSPGDLEKKDNFPPADQPASHDLNRALAEAAEEMDFEWPEFLPVEYIKARLTEIALGILIFAVLWFTRSNWTSNDTNTDQ